MIAIIQKQGVSHDKFRIYICMSDEHNYVDLLNSNILAGPKSGI